ncbi:hypothetical protein GCM10011584_31550 [Nocardioides phosphati]|uniref:Lipoprotein n=2 Tax=Nocardioides phosphati TaxID=1867775 RepID=A0ABQ2NF77_9ACTN|nr:hypothetical protein GCM10011584_31550 [Nocardioides phosphati]
MLLAALPFFVLLLAGCGEAVSSGQAGSSATVEDSTGPTARCAGLDRQVSEPSYGPSGYVDGDTPGDAPPNYAANHAFQQRMRLCGDDLVRANAEAARAKQALRRLPEANAAAVERVLGQVLHVDDGLMTVAGSGEVVDFVAESTVPGVTLVVCLDGTVGPDGVVVEANGPYAEGGCTKPVGGH